MNNQLSNSFLSLKTWVALLFVIVVSLTSVTAQESEAKINARITALTAKITAAPKDEDLLIERGISYLALGKTTEALADANSVIGSNPNSINALFLRGQVRGSRKNYDGAIADYTIAINAQPDRAFRAYLKRGALYEQKGDKEKARADYAKALEISNPKSPEAAEALARVGGAAGQVNSGTAGSSVTSLNRLNFYTAIAFSDASLEAEFIVDTLDEGVDEKIYGSALLNLLDKTGPLETILKGRPEAEDLKGVIKKLQTPADWKKLTGNLYNIRAKYRDSLAHEQKWYFDVGYSIAEVQQGIKEKDFTLSDPDDNLEVYVALTPEGTPSRLVAPLKEMLEILKKDELSDGDYAALQTQIKSVYGTIGQLKIEDKTGGR